MLSSEAHRRATKTGEWAGGILYRMGPPGWQILAELIAAGDADLIGIGIADVLPRVLHEPLAARIRSGDVPVRDHVWAPQVGLATAETRDLLIDRTGQEFDRFDVFVLSVWIRMLPQEDGAFAAPWFAELLASTDPDINQVAVGALAHTGVPDPAAAARLLPYLRSDAAHLAASAVAALGRVDPLRPGEPVPAWLLDALRDDRRAVIDSVALVLSEAEEIPPDLLAALEERATGTEEPPVRVLIALLRHADEAWLANWAGRAEPTAARWLATALRQTNGSWLFERREALAQTLAALEVRPEAEVRTALARALGARCADGLPWQRPLVRLLAEEEASVVDAAARALARLPRESVAPILEQEFDGGAADVTQVPPESAEAFHRRALLRAAYGPDPETELMRLLGRTEGDASGVPLRADVGVAILPAFPRLSPPTRAFLRAQLDGVAAARWSSLRRRMLDGMDADRDATWTWLLASLDAYGEAEDWSVTPSTYIAEFSPYIEDLRPRAEARIADESSSVKSRRWWRELVVECLIHRNSERERDAQSAND